MPAGQNKNAAPSRSAAGKSASLKIPLITSGPPGLPFLLRHAIVTGRPRRQRRLGGVSPRRRDRGIERGADLSAGVQSTLKGYKAL